MHYCFNDSDLRVKKDVSNLKRDALFWGRVFGKNYFFASCRTDPSATVPPVCWRAIMAITRSNRFRAGISFVHGLCEPAMIAISRSC